MPDAVVRARQQEEKRASMPAHGTPCLLHPRRLFLAAQVFLGLGLIDSHPGIANGKHRCGSIRSVSAGGSLQAGISNSIMGGGDSCAGGGEVKIGVE
jgi:hypothetical protein